MSFTARSRKAHSALISCNLGMDAVAKSRADALSHARIRSDYQRRKKLVAQKGIKAD